MKYFCESIRISIVRLLGQLGRLATLIPFVNHTYASRYQRDENLFSSR